MNTGRALFVLNYILDHNIPQIKDELSPKEAKDKMTQIIVNLTNIQIGVIGEIERIRKGEGKWRRSSFL